MVDRRLTGSGLQDDIEIFVSRDPYVESFQYLGFNRRSESAAQEREPTLFIHIIPDPALVPHSSSATLLRNSFATVEISAPTEMSMQSDAELRLVVTDVATKIPFTEGDEKIYLNVSAASQAFDVLPEDDIRAPLLKDQRVQFVISPKKTGDRRIWIQVSVKTSEEVSLGGGGASSSVLVQEEPVLLGLSSDTVRAIQIVALAIGLPGLIALGTQSIRDSLRARRKKEKNTLIIQP